MSKRALLVGINDYRRVNDLRGCETDVTNLRLLLKRFCGFQNDDVRMLVDSRATKAAIEERLDWLVRGAQPGDSLLFHFSGHGAQIRDRGEQDELRDGLDELICPHDMDWNGTFITDDDLRARLRVPVGVQLEVILDCCHSGSDDGELLAAPAGTPAVTSDDPRSAKPRFLRPPIDIASRHEGEALGRRSRPFRSIDPEARVLWAGCSDRQTSADASFGGVPAGAFTFFLCQHLRESECAITRSDLLERVRRSLACAGYAQIPQLEAAGPAERARVFSGGR